ncbi:MAG: hypothetical protein JWO74_2296 [Solirubrobacterales bacterium]|nr:hypothetical protein [Solirubrobacterales bacterium]
MVSISLPMHLVYMGNHGILDIHAFSTLVSVVILVGGMYGFMRMLYDIGRKFGGPRREFGGSMPDPRARPREP